MRSRGAGPVLGLLLLACIGRPALPDEANPGAWPAPQRALELPAARDLGDGARLPLCEIGAQLGIIVTIAGQNVNIVRREGGELRLKAFLPAERPLELGRAELLIGDGDAWAYPEDVPRLLGLRGALDVEAGQMLVSVPPTEAESLETFQIAKPVVLSRAPERQREKPKIRRLPDIATGGDGPGVLTEVMTGEASLGVVELSILNSPSMTGVYQDIVGPASSGSYGTRRDLTPGSPVQRTVSYMSMDLHEGDQIFTVGDVFDPIFGTATGIGMRTALNEGTWVGAAVVAPDDPLRDQREGQVSLQAGNSFGSHLSTDLAASLDGSYSLSGRWQRHDTLLHSSIVDRPDLWRHSTSLDRQILPYVKGYARFSQMGGIYAARADLMGLQWRLGRATLALERTRGVSAGEAWGNDAVSMSLLRGRLAGSVRYLAPSKSNGRSGLEWFLTRFDPSGRQVFFSSSAPTAGSPASARTYRLGSSWPVGRGLRLRTALGWARDGLRPEAKVEWRPARDKVITLQYGPFDMDASGGALDTAIVLQAGMAFGSTGRGPRGTGRVAGQVRDDRGRGVSDVAVVLEEVAITFTRSDGSFEFRDVKPGRQRVKIDSNRLHADLGGELHSRVVFVRENETERADFVVIRLCRISGEVYVRPASGGQGEPFAGAVLQLSNGQQARTNSSGRYSFVGLGPGRYTVSLVSSMDLSTLSPLGPASWSLNLQPGDEVDGADFAFERRERPVIFEVLTTGR